jgi:hypothetical protein
MKRFSPEHVYFVLVTCAVVLAITLWRYLLAS